MKFSRKTLLFIIMSYVIVLSVNVTMNFDFYKSTGTWLLSILFNLMMTTICWLGFLGLNRLVFKRMNWSSRPTLNIVLGTLIFATGGVLMAALGVKIFTLYSGWGENADLYRDACTYSAIFSMMIGMTVTAHQSLSTLKKTTQDNERMKQEMTRSQYETLKSQVNPHFLFNSLNTLTAIIPQQPDVAVTFVEQLSKVFRYSLQHSDQNTIDVATELKVVRSYLFLNERRYDGKLIVAIEISDEAMGKKIITQSLLMLAENAIKHNELSTNKPLTVRIYNEDGYLVVANTLQRKTILEPSTNVGLDNIKKRYALATAAPVAITEADGLFTVKLPLL